VMTIRSDRQLMLPLSPKWQQEPLKIFVNSLSDLFHSDVLSPVIARVFAVMAACPQHTFQLLTKRPGRMRSVLSDPDFWASASTQRLGGLGMGTAWPGDPLPNLWLGTSVEDQQRTFRLDQLRHTPAAVRFASLEPLLGPVDLTRWLPSLDWVIAGGESGPNARPMHPDWVRSIRDQCLAAGVPFLFKQWGQWRYAVEVDEVEAEQALKASGRPDPFARTSCYTVGLDGSYSNTEPPRPGNATMMRVGKKRAGRLLDGRTWDQFPQANRDVPGVSAWSAPATPSTNKPRSTPPQPIAGRAMGSKDKEKADASDTTRATAG
jgi:protein gp37